MYSVSPYCTGIKGRYIKGDIGVYKDIRGFIGVYRAFSGADSEPPFLTFQRVLSTDLEKTAILD